MIKIVALFGMAGSGKDTLQNLLAESLDVNPIVSATTRPPRDTEIDGEAYHFKTDDNFFDGGMVEYTQFRGWYYGTPYSSLDRNKVNIGVFNIAGIKQLKRSGIVEVLPIFVACEEKVRLLRQLNREEYPDCEEICRRFMTDKEDFDERKITFDYHIVNNTNDLSDALEAAVQLISDWDDSVNFK